MRSALESASESLAYLRPQPMLAHASSNAARIMRTRRFGTEARSISVSDA